MDATRPTHSYPLRVEGTLDPSLSRWLWVVKWLLAIPHFIVLAFLWAAFIVMSVVAFFAILFTGRYPRSIFDFNVGVLRWTWRVVFYAYGALGTDRYPPFTLDHVADYPATLDIDYPQRLSRGLVLVKWWLLAIPQYLIVALFVGGGAWFGRGEGRWFLGGGGLILVLVLIAAVGMLFTGRYARGIFDFVLGLDRWVLRVAAYAGLMTDVYPPFRLDKGGSEGVAAATEPAAVPETAVPEAVPKPSWTGGRIVAVVIGGVLALVALGLLAGGAAAVVVDQTQRDSDGFLMTPSERFDTASYALVTNGLDVTVDVPQWVIDELIGTVRLRSESGSNVFVGIAPEAEASRYLDRVDRAVVTDIGRNPEYVTKPGGAPSGPPARQTFWVASTSGAGEQVLDWKVEDGQWVVVVMNVDGSRGVTSDLSIGAEVDPLIWIGIGLLGGGLLLALVAAGVIYAGIPKAKTG
jgi:Domain of unknown function (DUF4389)